MEVKFDPDNAFHQANWGLVLEGAIVQVKKDLQSTTDLSTKTRLEAELARLEKQLQGG